MCIQRWLEQNRNFVNANSKLAALAPLSNHRKTFSKMPFHKPSDRFNQVGRIPSPKHEIRWFAGAFGAHGSCLLARRKASGGRDSAMGTDGEKRDLDVALNAQYVRINAHAKAI
jgi:hypothetical protein